MVDKISENDLNQNVPEKCVRRNFDIEGSDMISPDTLPHLNLVECQNICQQTVGCYFFTYKMGSVDQCFLKLASGEKAWKERTGFPRTKAYSGSVDCGKKEVIVCNFNAEFR